MKFQFPPSPAVGLQPGFTLPPILMSGPPLPPFDFAVAILIPTSGSNLTPPPVNQQAFGTVVVVVCGVEHPHVSAGTVAVATLVILSVEVMYLPVAVHLSDGI